MTLSRLQSEFVAAVSHEFRTPLTTLKQFTELLGDDAALAPETRRRYYQAQARATDRLHRLVESLLDFGRMEADRHPYVLARLDAGALIRDVVDEWRPAVSARGLSLRDLVEPGDHPIDADADALACAIGNLIDNAVKYSGDGQEIAVTVGTAGADVLVAVRDRGIGVPAAEQARIFEKFVRGAAATARHIKGTGIGLAMVRHIVAGHGGSVHVTSAEREGSTFTVRLPRA
jgi:signal transduction histidine kinase